MIFNCTKFKGELEKPKMGSQKHLCGLCKLRLYEVKKLAQKIKEYKLINSK